MNKVEVNSGFLLSISIVFILVLSIVLRFYRIEQIPPALTWDEVSWGYIADSLLRTGADEYGRKIPLDYLESFGDFKPPLYAYLTIIPLYFFGLNEFSTRFISAFFGFLMVLTTYFLTKELFYSSKNKVHYAVIACLFIAISPWHINLSRAAFEANVAATLIAAGIFFFLKFLNSKGFYIIFSSICFSLSLLTFNSARIVTPLIVIFLAVVFYKKLFKNLVPVIIAILVSIIIVIPSVPFLLSDSASLRFKEVNIFSDPEPVIRANQQILNTDNALWSRIISNRRVFYVREYVTHYLDHFDPGYLFIAGDQNPKFSTQRLGQFYFLDSIFLLMGIIVLFRKKEGYWYLIPVVILISIIPAGVARETPHALRTINMLPMPQMLAAYGLYWIIKNIFSINLNKYLKYLLIFTIFSIIIIQFIYYIHDYYRHYSREFSHEWQYGYKEAFEYVLSNYEKYEKIYFTNSLGRPHMYFLFYGSINPQVFREKSIIERDSFGFVNVKKVDKVLFVDSVRKVKPESDVLYVAEGDNAPIGGRILKKIHDLSGRVVFVIYRFE